MLAVLKSIQSLDKIQFELPRNPNKKKMQKVEPDLLVERFENWANNFDLRPVERDHKVCITEFK